MNCKDKNRELEIIFHLLKLLKYHVVNLCLLNNLSFWKKSKHFKFYDSEEMVWNHSAKFPAYYKLLSIHQGSLKKYA